MPSHETFEIKVFKTLEDVEKLRGFWSAQKCDPEADIDFVTFIIKSRPEIIQPCVIVLYQDGAPVSLLAARIENHHLEIKLGYKVFWKLKVRRLAVFYGGLMGRTDVAASEAIIGRALQCLKEENASLLVWSGVQQESDLQRQLGRIPGLFCRDYLARPIQRWKMTMPASLEELLEKRMNKKHRYWAKRTMRLLEKDFAGAVRFTAFSGPQDVDKLFAEVIKVAAKTYQWALGVGFRDNDEQRKRLALEAEKGWMRAYVLYVKDEPAAFWICTVYGETVYSDYTGYDPQYRKYEIGTSLFLRMVGEMCREPVKQLDFGPGSAPYKERFGDSELMEATQVIFVNTLRGCFLNFVRLMTEGPLEAARALLKRFGLEQKLKKMWRSHVTPDAAVKEPLEALAKKA